VAIAIDASSPTLKTTGGGNCTTASFTAPANALLVAFFEILGPSTGSDPTVTDSLGDTSPGWTKAVERKGDATYGYAGAWWTATTGSSARTVSVSCTTTANNKAMQLVVFTGAATASAIGATAVGTASTAINTSLTATQVGSWTWACYSENAGAATGAGGAGTTVKSSTNAAEGFGCFYHTAQATAVDETDTVILTAPTDATSWALCEILAPAAAAGGPPESFRFGRKPIGPSRSKSAHFAC
jgi:hypothetical protein